MSENYHISHARLYSLKGGIARFKYSMAHLKEAVDAETQFVARSIPDKEGEPDKNKASGPDDMEFVLRTVKSASETFDVFIPKHIKPTDISIIVYSDKELTVTLSESGQTSKTAIGQIYELMRSYILNFVLHQWFIKSGIPNVAGNYIAIATTARQSIQKVLMHSFILRRLYGSRYPVVTYADTMLPLQGKFLGSYRTISDCDAVHKSDIKVADVVYIEEQMDYMIYSGSEWEKLADRLSSATALDANEINDYPNTANIGNMHVITKTGTLGKYRDRVVAGDALLCIRDNRESQGKYKNTLENFMVIGSITAE